MKLFLLLVLAVLFQSCTPILLVNKEDLKHIPYGATKVISLTPVGAKETAQTLARSFAKSGCPVRFEELSMQVVCDGKPIEGGTSLKVMAYIEEVSEGTLVTMSGEWGLDASGQVGFAAITGLGSVTGTNRIVWEGLKATKPCVAFQHMILMSIAIPESMQRYAK